MRKASMKVTHLVSGAIPSGFKSFFCPLLAVGA